MTAPRFPIEGHPFIAGGKILFLPDVGDEPNLRETPDADELGLDPEDLHDDEVW